MNRACVRSNATRPPAIILLIGTIGQVLIEDPALREGLDLSQISDEFRAMLGYEVRQLRRVCEKVEYYIGRIEAVSAQLDEVRRLQTVPGIGPIVASSLVAMAVSSDAVATLPPG